MTNFLSPLAQGARKAACEAVREQQIDKKLSPAMFAIVETAVAATLQHIVDWKKPEPVKRIQEEPQRSTDLGGDPVMMAKAKGFSGNSCRNCGGINLLRSGTCETCQDCGSTTGCS